MALALFQKALLSPLHRKVVFMNNFVKRITRNIAAYKKLPMLKIFFKDKSFGCALEGIKKTGWDDFCFITTNHAMGSQHIFHISI